MTPARGYKVVLTADRTLMSAYKLLFDGMLAASQTTTTPLPLMDLLLLPRTPTTAEGRATLAPLGLRRIEASLLRGGFTPDQVAVVPPGALHAAIGTDTQVVGICSGEPTGFGMNSSMMTAVAGGSIYPLALFRRLIAEVHDAVRAANAPARVVLGGPGAWQVAGNPEARAELGIDCVVSGYAEGDAPALFRALCEQGEVDDTLACRSVTPEEIPPIAGASTMGVVEISRGCGLGCSFCTIARTPMIHLPKETILADARTNIAAGMPNIATLSEDFFRYGARGMQPDPGKLIDLLTGLRELEGLRLLQIDHVNVISVAGFTDTALRTVHGLLVGDNRHDYPWVNIGVETASGRLLKTNGGAAKMGKSGPDAWGRLCADQVRRLIGVGFLPMVSLVLGLPGETEADVRATLDWVRSFSRERVTIFPMLYAPVDGRPSLTRDDLTPLHWEVIRESYRLNFRWTPRMYWDNQRGAGIPAARRLLMQGLGWGQVLQWNALFAYHARAAKVRAARASAAAHA